MPEHQAAHQLLSAELSSFNDNGYVGPFELYTPEEMEVVRRTTRAHLMNRQSAPYVAPVESAIANYDRHLDVPLLSRHICRPEIVRRLVSILGPDVLCWRSEFIPKQPGAEGTDWHQADTFEHASGQPQLVWPHTDGPGGCINVWTAFTVADEDNGCLLFIPGTQKHMHYDESKGMTYDPEANRDNLKGGMRMSFAGYDYSVLQKDPDWTPDLKKAVPMVMRPGEFIIFRSTMLHASMPNRTTDRPRLGYVARYVPGCVKVYPDTDAIREFGGEISLSRYGVVPVAGRNLAPSNRVANQNLRGEPFGSGI